MMPNVGCLFLKLNAIIKTRVSNLAIISHVSNGINTRLPTDFTRNYFFTVVMDDCNPSL